MFVLRTNHLARSISQGRQHVRLRHLSNSATSQHFSISPENGITFQGIGLHTGKQVSLTVQQRSISSPSSSELSNPYTSVQFRRIDNDAKPIPCHWTRVQHTSYCTRICNSDSSHGVSTVEHLMAAVAGLGFWDLSVTLDGPEVPILDGSSLIFGQALQASVHQSNHGNNALPCPSDEITCIEVLKPCKAEIGHSRIELIPSQDPLEISVDFELREVGMQSFEFKLGRNDFLKEIAPARTFTYKEEVDKLKKAGLVKGGSLENAVVFDGSSVLNPEGLRFGDEGARHKALDCLGDLALAGGVLMAKFHGVRPGHTINQTLLKVLFADPSNYRIFRAPRSQIYRND